ncbi:MAG: type IV pilus twitching motility protein PilT [Vicinamibacteria bacterium]|nr:type IV pilus twitching motility protein PilT [Vicinamibacteria bacterium]
MASIDVLLKAAVDQKASDLHLSVGMPPILRQFGELKKLPYQPLTADQTAKLVNEILSPEQRRHLEAEWELDFAYEIPGLARFRSNAFQQRKGLDACFRVVKLDLPGFEELGIPESMRRVCENHQGLILVTGAAGSGKSTTLAAMVDLINTESAHHVLTAEDPIEFVHSIKKGAINQRQLNTHTKSYGNALKAALREDPDVIMVGELRDLETISLAISASETGHLVIGSMNTSSAHKTIDKVIDSYPAAQQNQIRAMLGESLKAVFSQRLLPRADGTGMILAYELLLGSTQLANLIKDGKTFQIPNIMQMGKSQGLRTMDDTLLEHLRAGLITLDVALKNALNPKAFPAAPPPPPPAAASATGVTSRPAAPGAPPGGLPRPASPGMAPRPQAPGGAPPRSTGASARPGAPTGVSPRPPVKPEGK